MRDVLFSDPQGPVQELTWGRFVIEGVEHAEVGEGRSKGAGKNVCVIGGEVTKWKKAADQPDRHHPTAKSFRCVEGQGLEAVVIGRGIEGAMEVPGRIVKGIRVTGIPRVIVERTAAACRIYNELARQGVRVALLAHGTC